MAPTSPPPTDPSRPGPDSHASGDEEDVTERRSLLAADPGGPADGPGTAAAAAALTGRPGGPALYLEGAGRHQPIFGGQCLSVQGGDDACDMAWFSALVRSASFSSASYGQEAQLTRRALPV